MRSIGDPFQAEDHIDTKQGSLIVYKLIRLEEGGVGRVSHLPFSIKILLESLLRQVDGQIITEDDVKAVAQWTPEKTQDREIPLIPARVILQDFTGVPAVVDLAAMRSAIRKLGGDPDKIIPLVPADLVIDHSVQVDYYGALNAQLKNEKKEFERNRERYALLRWAQNAFDNFRVVPPGKGIVHQVNLEYLAPIVHVKEMDRRVIAYPDSLLGTDSHTTMINGLGVLGWGVGGIEAEAVMLGQPYYMTIPEVVGFKLYGELKEGVTATDLVLTVTQMLREHGVVGKFVEFYGPGLGKLSLPDRATIANMTPEYGATLGFFPLDDETLRYLLETGRDEKHVDLVRRYAVEQGLLVTPESEPLYTTRLELDLGNVESSLAGPKRPQDRIPLTKMKSKFHEYLDSIYAGKTESKPFDPNDPRWVEEGGNCSTPQTPTRKSREALYKTYPLDPTNDEGIGDITDGSVVIAAITSCTNTSNPTVLIGAGLLAKKAVEHGLKVKPYVKSSLAPGSRVVTDYLRKSGLLSYLERLRFHVVGYGCTTCIGNSGPLPDRVEKAVKEHDLIVAAVLSGNRNFEGRIHPLVKANYLASPPLVVAYALAGRVNIDVKNEPLGYDPNGSPVFLRDIWPQNREIQQILRETIDPEMFKTRYSEVFEGTRSWRDLRIPDKNLYEWDPTSTYIREPPFFQDFSLKPPEKDDVHGARVLAFLGDSITTDHISPAGAIPPTSPAGKYLISHGIEPDDFNSYGSRRGNHEVMIRGTFGNVRLRNRLTPDKEGGWTRYHPSGEEMTIFDAAARYLKENIPLLVLAGKEYGTGSSRDWAAKGTFLLGVKAVIAESYERIHRANLVGMGVLPLQFTEGETADTYGLKGDEVYMLKGVRILQPMGDLTVEARTSKGVERRFTVRVRLDTPIEVEYYRNGGILHTVLRNMVKKEGK